MVVFCLYNAKGDIFDYDFEKINRPHKLERVRFFYRDIKHAPAGLKIDSIRCISCGKCEKVCSFSAIKKVKINII